MQQFARGNCKCYFLLTPLYTHQIVPLRRPAETFRKISMAIRVCAEALQQHEGHALKRRGGKTVPEGDRSKAEYVFYPVPTASPPAELWVHCNTLEDEQH